MTDRELMQQALEALEDIFGKNKIDVGVINRLRDRLAQPEHEPVAWMYVNTDGECEQIEYIENDPMPDDPSITSLYTAPRQWQGLTYAEIGLLTTNDKWSHIETPVLALFARAIEAKLKEKNARPVKPLTDEAIDTYFQEYINTGSLLSFADGVRFAEAAHSGAIEAKLKEKNT